MNYDNVLLFFGAVITVLLYFNLRLTGQARDVVKILLEAGGQLAAKTETTIDDELIAKLKAVLESKPELTLQDVDKIIYGKTDNPVQ